MDLNVLERMSGRAVPRGELEQALERLEVVEDVEALRARRVSAFGDWVPWASAAEESAPFVDALATLQHTDDAEGLRARHVEALDGWIPWGVNDASAS